MDPSDDPAPRAGSFGRAGPSGAGPTGLPIDFADVAAARERERERLPRTPQARSATLSQLTGAEVTVKFENLQFTASFKERGALNRLLLLTPEERVRGVVTVSAGNHAQAVARHAAALGIRASVVMPTTTPLTKVERTRVLGATAVLEGETFEEAAAAARRMAALDGQLLVHPYDDPAVMAGQGTLAIEMLEDDPDLEVIVVPVGGGGLLAGVATAVRHLAPHVEVVGVQSERYCGMAAALLGRPPGSGGPTVADGIAVGRPGDLALQVARALVDEILVVGEAAIERAIGAYLELEKVVAEGAGAIPLAALMEHRRRFAGRRVGLVLSGGNIDLRMLADVVLRDLARLVRLAWVRLEVPDLPGTLAVLAGIVARSGANIVEVIHRRHHTSLAPRGTEVDLQLETNGPEHLQAVVSELRTAGFAVRVPSAEG
jgi:threonine dehydratase